MLLMLALALSLLAACGGGGASDATGTPTDGTPASSDAAANASAEDAQVAKEVKVGIATDPANFEVWPAYNAGRNEMITLLYQTMICTLPNFEDNTMTVYYILASGYEKIDDTTYEIYVRDGIYDTNGYPFTASDAAFCYETAKAQGTLAQLNAIDHCEVVDELTFRIITNDTLAVGDFEDLLNGFYMVTQKSYEESTDGMATTPVGTTGYVLKEYISGSRVVFEATGDYWNSAANESKNVADGYCYVWETKLDKVTYEIITDTSTMAIALETGAIDISADLSGTDIGLFQEGGANADDFSAYAYPENMYALSFNTHSGSVMNNYNLRMAIAHCVDSEAILNATYDGVGTTMNAWSYPSYVDYLPEWDNQPYFEYDMALAKEYLEKFYEETGTNANTLSMKLLTMSSSTMEKTAEAVQASIATLVGNQTCCEIVSFDRATYNQEWLDPANFDLMVINFQSITRTYSVYNWNLYGNASKNRNGSDMWYDDSEEFQSIVDAVISEDTHNDETVRAFHAYVTDNAYIKNMICGNVYVVTRNWISGFDQCMGAKSSVAVNGLEYDWSASAH